MIHMKWKTLFLVALTSSVAYGADSTDVPLSKVELSGMNGEHLVVEATTQRIVSVVLTVSGGAIPLPDGALSEPFSPGLNQLGFYDCSDPSYPALRQCYIVEIPGAYKGSSGPEGKFGVYRFEFRNGRLSSTEIDLDEEGGRAVVSKRDY